MLTKTAGQLASGRDETGCISPVRHFPFTRFIAHESQDIVLSRDSGAYCCY